MAEITLGGNPANTKSDLPAVGSDAPTFTLTKPDMSDMTLSDLSGKKVILNIFPSVDTSVCATSTRKFNENAASLDNTAVVCVSMDLPFAISRFCAAEGIENVTVASNFRDGGQFGDSYGVEILDGAFRGLNARAIVVLDESGKVKHTELVSEIGHEPNYENALNALS